MPKVSKTNASGSTKKVRPALTPESNENLMISLAMDLVKQRLIDGTASSQETTHFLKLASSKAQLELANLREQNELLKAKTSQIKSQENQEALFRDAIAAMKRYSGERDSDEEEEEYDDYYDEY